MRGFLTLCLLLVGFPAFLSAQQDLPPIDERLYDVYEADYLQRLQTANPQVLQRLNFYLDHAYYLTEYPAEKGNPEFPEVIIEDLESINILLLEKEQQLRHALDRPTQYQVKGTNLILVYLPGEKFQKDFRASQEQ
jgi:hypothetical protein